MEEIYYFYERNNKEKEDLIIPFINEKKMNKKNGINNLFKKQKKYFNAINKQTDKNIFNLTSNGDIKGRKT